MENFTSILATATTTATKKKAAFWAQVAGAVAMTAYILRPSPLPYTDALPIVAWLCILVTVGVTLSYVAQPWFAGYFALFAVMALHVTRGHVLRRFAADAMLLRQREGEDPTSLAILEDQQTQMLQAKLAGVDGRTKTLEEMLVDEFVPLGKTYLAGGKEDIRALPVMRLP